MELKNSKELKKGLSLHFNLKTQIFIILALLFLITVSGGTCLVWYTFRMERVLTRIISEDVKGFQRAEALETALVNQKGFVSYYYLDKNANWLRQLGEFRQIFKAELENAYSLAGTREQKEILQLIEKHYNIYTETKDKVITFYQSGENNAGSLLHPQTRDLFSEILMLCERFKGIHKNKIEAARRETHNESKKLRIFVGLSISVFLGLMIILSYILILNILQPVRRLIKEASRSGLNKKGNEIQALSRSVHGLIQEAVQTQLVLAKSRESLLQAEKMAIVGKLAAGTAHSIRNPLTSVKMRLFSLSRSLGLSDMQKEDFTVISQEIRHIDNILQNFLEFSRPPTLKIQAMSPSQVVDMAIQLLSHRLRFHDVNVTLIREKLFEETKIDPEQLKEALVNLMINSCEAMGKGGAITIREEEAIRYPVRYAAIHLTDTGPGISHSVKEKIFEPFYTTKDEGTGLGLSIVSRIINEHGGWVEASSEEERGATFSIFLPIKE